MSREVMKVPTYTRATSTCIAPGCQRLLRRVHPLMSGSDRARFNQTARQGHALWVGDGKTLQNNDESARPGLVWKLLDGCHAGNLQLIQNCSTQLDTFPEGFR